MAKIHSVHHKTGASPSFTAIHFHPVEYITMTLCFLAGPAIMPTHIYTLYIWIVIRQYIAIESHSGLFFRFNPINLIPFYDGSLFHYLHHKKGNYNFGLFFNYWDKFFGTYKHTQMPKK